MMETFWFFHRRWVPPMPRVLMVDAGWSVTTELPPERATETTTPSMPVLSLSAWRSKNMPKSSWT